MASEQNLKFVSDTLKTNHWVVSIAEELDRRDEALKNQAEILANGDKRVIELQNKVKSLEEVITQMSADKLRMMQEAERCCALPVLKERDALKDEVARLKAGWSVVADSARCSIEIHQAGLVLKAVTAERDALKDEVAKREKRLTEKFDGCVREWSLAVDELRNKCNILQEQLGAMARDRDGLLKAARSLSDELTRLKAENESLRQCRWREDGKHESAVERIKAAVKDL